MLSKSFKPTKRNALSPVIRELKHDNRLLKKDNDALQHELMIWRQHSNNLSYILDGIKRAKTFRVWQIWAQLKILIKKAIFGQKHFLTTDVYQRWLEDNSPQRILPSAISPLASPLLLIGVIDQNADWTQVRQSLSTLEQQSYPYWELCLVVHSKAKIWPRLRQYTKRNLQISLHSAKSSLDIPEIINRLLKNKKRSFVGLILFPLALFPITLQEVQRYLGEHEQTDVLYFDEDTINSHFQHHDPLFKPDFSLDLFLANNYLGNFIFLNTKIFRKHGFFSKNQAFLYEYLLKLSEYPTRFAHLPVILFSEFLPLRIKKANRTNKSSLEISLQRRGWTVNVTEEPSANSLTLRYQTKTSRLVSVIVPTKDHVDLLRKSIDGVLNQPYQNFEILIVNNNSEQPETLAYFAELAKYPQITILDFTQPFNISRIFNFAVEHARGEYILLLNNDIEPITKDWLSPLVGYMQRADIGGVAPKLLYPNGTLQHAGVLLGMKNNPNDLGVAGHPFKGMPDSAIKENPRFFFKDLTRNWSAVTGACFLTKKSLYQKVGGFQEEDLKVLFSDIDFCLRLRQHGFQIVYDPHVVLTHHESISVGKVEETGRKIDLHEILYMRETWGKLIDNDPFYNPQLSLFGQGFTLATAPEDVSFSILSALTKLNAVNKGRKVIKILIQQGPAGLYRKIQENRIVGDQVAWYNYQYQQWIQKNEPQHLSLVTSQLKKLEYRPKISILLPTYNSDIRWLDKSIESVKNQLYDNWEICIVDDGSTQASTLDYLHSLHQQNIQVTFNQKNQGISAATQLALQQATGEYIALLDHDDELAPHALAAVVVWLNKYPEADMIYSDEDKLDEQGRRCDVFFKPDWSPEYFLSSMYTCHLGVYRTALAKKIGGFRVGYEGSQDYDFVLRFTEKTKNIQHIPMVLYHWRKIVGSTATVYTAKSYAQSSTERALLDAMKRRHLRGKLLPGIRPDLFYVQPTIIKQPLVSIIIPTKDGADYLKRCIDSITQKTHYPNYEIIVVNNQSTELEALAYFDRIQKRKNITVLNYQKPFNYSDINNYAAQKSQGDFLLFLNNDTEVVEPRWLEALLEYAQLPEIGAVGAKLLYPNGLLQHGGIILGIAGMAGHSQKLFPASEPGKLPIFNNKDVIRNWSAVTAACLMIEKKKYFAVNGMDPLFRVAFNDVDLCLRLSQQGLRHVYTPFAVLYHHESVSVGRPETRQRDDSLLKKEVTKLQKRWGTALKHDPYYNENLTLEKEDLSIRL